MRGLIALLFASALALASGGVAAGCTRNLTVAASPVGRGLMISDGGQVSGSIRDFLDGISSRTGCTFGYVSVPRARAWAMLETNGVDLVPAATQSPARDRYARFIRTHTVNTMLAGVDQRVTGINALDEIFKARLQIGVVRGYQFGAAYDDLIIRLERAGLVHKVPDPETLVRLMATGRVHATVVPLTAISDAVEKAGIASALLTSELPELPKMEVGIYLSTGRLRADELELLEQAIRVAVAKGDYALHMRRVYPAWSLRGVNKN